jgi:replicative DNA helicase
MAVLLSTNNDNHKDLAAEKPLREAPYNLEAEQALLGAILTNNEALNHVDTNLKAEHFYVEIHNRIFTSIMKFYEKGMVANPVTLKQYFKSDDGVEDGYLIRLVTSSPNVINVRDYCRIIIDLALKRSLIDVGGNVVNSAYDYKAETSGIEQVEEAEQMLFNLASVGSSEGGFNHLSSVLHNTMQRAEVAYKSEGNVVGVRTGLKDMDRLLGGLQDSDLIILAGRPSMGKTALATSIAFNAAKIFAQNDKNEAKIKSVGFFSLEMSSEQLAGRMLASAAGINSTKIQRGDMSNEEFAELVRNSNELARLPYHIDDTPALSIAALRTRARRLKRVANLGLIVVDYLQLVTGTGHSRSQGRVQEISEITQGLKAIAKELNVPVIALSQLSRAVESREDKRPQLSDLRESGSIEQDADVVMFVYREEYYLSRTEPRMDTPEHATWMEKMEKVYGLADVIVAKQRHGPIGTVTMQFQSNLTRFEDLANDKYIPQQHY